LKIAGKVFENYWTLFENGGKKFLKITGHFLKNGGKLFLKMSKHYF